MSIRSKISILLMSLVLVIFSGLVSADSPNFDLEQLDVNDLTVFDASTGFLQPNIDIERGDTLEIEVTLKGEGNATSGGNVTSDDTVITAKILGYEFGIIADSTEIFSVDAGVVYKKNLVLNIPIDIDASQFYTLRIEASDSIDEEQLDFTLNVDESRHDLNIFDVVVNPSSTVSAGQPVFVTVRVENLGEKKEEDVKVMVSIPSLGISAVNYIEELVTQNQEEQELFKLGEEAQRQVDLLLRIPEDAASGTYPVNVEVTYNRGHSTVTTQRSLTVKGMEKEEEAEVIVNIDSTTRSSKPGEEVVYKLMFANLGTKKAVLSVQGDGFSPWSEFFIEPSFITVLPESTAEVLVRVTPNTDAQPKDYLSSIKIFLGNELINEMSLRTKVEGKATVATGATTFKTVLTIIFAVLVVILIVLGLVIAFRRMREEETEEPHSTVPEGQTYYYYPKQ